MDNDFQRRLQAKLAAGIDQVRAARMEDERRRLMSTIGQDLATMLQPFLVEVATSAKANKESMRDAMAEALGVLNSREQHIDTAPIIGAIEAAFMNIQMPEPKVTVTVPDNIFKDFKLPDPPDMSNVRGIMSLLANGREVGYENPMPVILYDAKNNPLNLYEQIRQQISGGGGGGKADFFTVKDIQKSIAVVTVNPDGNPYYPSSAAGASSTVVTLINNDGLAYNSDNPLPVTFSAASVQPVSQVSGAAWSVSVNDIFGSVGTNVINPDGRVKVELPSGASGLTDTELRASAVPMTQVSGAAWSMSVNDIFGSVGTNVINPDNRVSVQLPDNPVPVYQVSGALFSIQATDIFSTLAASTVVNPDNRVRVEVPTYTQAISVTDIFATSVASNVVNPDNRLKVELPATTVTVSGVTASIQSALIDSSGVQYSGSNPVPITVVSGALTSTVSVGDSAARTADNGGNPVKVGGIARQTNPAAFADGDRSNVSTDDLGRQLVRPVQVRDLTVTAYTSISTGTEATLLAASAGNFHDLVYVMFANSSDAAVLVDVRAVTAGNIIMTVAVPANGTAGVSMGGMPIPGSGADTGNNWTIDMPDITGTTIYATALFSREV